MNIGLEDWNDTDNNREVCKSARIEGSFYDPPTENCLHGFSFKLSHRIQGRDSDSDFIHNRGHKDAICSHRIAGMLLQMREFSRIECSILS